MSRNGTRQRRLPAKPPIAYIATRTEHRPTCAISRTKDGTMTWEIRSFGRDLADAMRKAQAGAVEMVAWTKAQQEREAKA